MPTVNLTGFGHREVVDLSASTLTLTQTAHSAKVVNCLATTTITLPAVAAPHRFTIRVGKAGITVTISPNASDLIAGPGAANSGAGADNKDIVFTNQPAGSYVVLEWSDATGYAISDYRGTFTYEA
jgi:hypothetical protein